MSDTARSTISAFVVCANEQRSISRCLDSLRWCDEIIVIDSGSTDQTLNIAAKYTTKIIHREWSGYVAQKRFGLEQCSSEWVINLDADEEVSPQLKVEIEEKLILDKRGGLKGIDGFQINRVVYYLGKWWRRGLWYPEYRLRVCRRSATTWGGEDPHEKASVQGSVQRLKGELFHYTYVDIRDHVARLNSHSSSAAQSMFKRGKRASLRHITLSPLLRIFKCLVLKRGVLEGARGLIVALLEGYYVFLKYIKLLELQNKERWISS